MHFQRRGIMNYSYSVGDIVGRGFSSIVYKGMNDHTQEEVAIKVIQRQISDQIPLIQNEITILSKLKGNYILKLYDYFYTKNNIYIITELCKQGDLQSYIKKHGKLNSNIAIQIIIQIIYGIASMQSESKSQLIQKDIIHRDLKPQNILISNNTIRIADFGFAKNMSQLVSSEMNVGTPLYMSPETLIRNQYHLKSDIWSFGVMAYEILFGIPPWIAQNERDLIQEITKNQITIPDQQVIPKYVIQLIQSCLIVDLNNRFNISDILNSRLFVKQQNKNTFKTVKINRLAAPVIPKITKNDSDQFIIIDNSIQIISIQGYQNYFNVIKFILSENYKLISPWLKEKLCILSTKHMTILSSKLINMISSDSNNSENTIKQQGLDQICQDNSKIQLMFQNQLNKISSITEFSNDIIKYDQEFSHLINNLTKEGLLYYIKMSIQELNHDLYMKIKLQNVIQYTKELQILKTLSQYYEILQKYGLLPTFNQNDLLQCLDQITHNQKYLIEYRHFLELRYEIKQILK